MERNMKNLVQSLSSVVLTFVLLKNILTTWNRFVNIITNHITKHIINIEYFHWIK